jgi:hypothetical protein
MRQLAMLLLVTPLLLASGTNPGPAIVKCIWEGPGPYPLHIARGTYKLEPGKFQYWEPLEWKWKPFRCEKFPGQKIGCNAAVSDSRYEFIDEYDDPQGQHGWTYNLSIDRMTGHATVDSGTYHYNGSSDDGDRRIHRLGKCEKVADPSLSARPEPKL